MAEPGRLVPLELLNRMRGAWVRCEVFWPGKLAWLTVLAHAQAA